MTHYSSQRDLLIHFTLLLSGLGVYIRGDLVSANGLFQLCTLRCSRRPWILLPLCRIHANALPVSARSLPTGSEWNPNLPVSFFLFVLLWLLDRFSSPPLLSLAIRLLTTEQEVSHSTRYWESLMNVSERTRASVSSQSRWVCAGGSLCGVGSVLLSVQLSDLNWLWGIDLIFNFNLKNSWRDCSGLLTQTGWKWLIYSHTSYQQVFYQRLWSAQVKKPFLYLSFIDSLSVLVGEQLHKNSPGVVFVSQYIKPLWAKNKKGNGDIFKSVFVLWLRLYLDYKSHWLMIILINS